MAKQIVISTSGYESVSPIIVNDQVAELILRWLHHNIDDVVNSSQPDEKVEVRFKKVRDTVRGDSWEMTFEPGSQDEQEAPFVICPDEPWPEHARKVKDELVKLAICRYLDDVRKSEFRKILHEKLAECAVSPWAYDIITAAMDVVDEQVSEKLKEIIGDMIEVELRKPLMDFV